MLNFCPPDDKSILARCVCVFTSFPCTVGKRSLLQSLAFVLKADSLRHGGGGAESFWWSSTIFYFRDLGRICRYICNLAVDNQWRKKAIGTALIKICEDTAKDGWKEDFLHLRVRRKNKNAIEFYKNLGSMIDPYHYGMIKTISGDDIILLKNSLSGARLSLSELALITKFKNRQS